MGCVMSNAAVPVYWMHETTGVLRPVVEAYFSDIRLDGQQLATMRAYLRQWIAGDWVPSPELEKLRARIDGITTHEALSEWLNDAYEIGIDPL